MWHGHLVPRSLDATGVLVCSQVRRLFPSGPSPSSVAGLAACGRCPQCMLSLNIEVPSTEGKLQPNMNGPRTSIEASSTPGVVGPAIFNQRHLSRPRSCSSPSDRPSVSHLVPQCCVVTIAGVATGTAN